MGLALALVCGWAGIGPSAQAAEAVSSVASAQGATLTAPFRSEEELSRYFKRRTAEIRARTIAEQAARTPPAPPQPTAALSVPVPDVDVITVTGTRLPQSNLTTVSPVTAISSEDIANNGVSSTADIVNQLPQAFADGITNVQEAGVDEGDIVKLRGDILVILRRGRLFTVSIAGGAMKPVASIAAYPPGVNASADWYDEMLIAGDRVIVVGYSYGRGGTEINRFHIDAAGRLTFEDAYHVRSNDYYSSRNYASRRIGHRLIFYSPLYFSLWGDPLASFPALRRWTGAARAPFQRIGGARQVYFSPRLKDEEFQAIHTVTSCDLTAPVLDCTATSVLGAAGRTFYVSPRAVYVWVTPWRWHSRGPGIPETSMLYRLPLDGGAPSAIGVSGAPVDQFSFREDADDGVVNVLVRAESRGDAMWAPERSGGATALLRLPLSAFGDGARDAEAGRYRDLPIPMGDSYDFHNRFVGAYVLYGVGNGWYTPRTLKPILVVVPVRGGPVAELKLPHGIDRIEVMGPNAVVIGNDERDLYFSSVELEPGREPMLGDRYVLTGAAQAETRSHGFFFKREIADGEEGVIGLPVAKPARAAYRHLFETSAAMLFLRRDERRFARIGELAAHDSGAIDDNCAASCTDWYGNARPIFLGGRTFALMGYELVEGLLASRSIREIARVNFAPPAAPPKPPPAPEPTAAEIQAQAEAAKPDFARGNPEWQHDQDSDCWAWMSRAWHASSPWSWVGGCEQHRATGAGTLTFSWSYGGKLVLNGTFRAGRLVRGTMKYSDGDEISGEFKDGILSGRGMIVHPDGARETGVFKDGKLNGPGVRTWPQGIRYEGRFVEGQLEGPGKFSWPEGDRYAGVFKGGIEEGHGTYTFADGSVLEGDFHDGAIAGQAVLRRPNGTRVKGDVVPPSNDPAHPDSNGVYPPLSVRLGEEGRVVIAFRVGTDGAVAHPYILVSSGRARLDTAALTAVANSRRLPATIGGVPIAVKTMRSVVFKLVTPPPPTPTPAAGTPH